jgi:hypothetical protein
MLDQLQPQETRPTVPDDPSIVNGNGSNHPKTDPNSPDEDTNGVDVFFPVEEFAALAKESVREAIADMHAHGISTYGMRDGIIYETKPDGEVVPVSK